MTIGKAIARTAKGLWHSDRGHATMMLALSAVPMFLAAGAAVDYVRYNDAATNLQASLDSGALAAAAARGLPDSQRIAAAETTFDRNISVPGVDVADVTRSFDVADGTVEASAQFELPTAFMRLAGINTLTVGAESEIAIPEDRKAEIALVLDYSGSMTEISGGKVKYVAMRDAAQKLVTDLEDANPASIKFALVPFSHHVRVTLPKKFVVGQSGGGNWTGCTQDRRYPYNVTDATPVTTDDNTKWGWPQAPAHLSEGCSAYAPRGLTVLPLTSDTGVVKSQLAAMQPYAWTHIALGVEFGYHVLSGNEPFTEGAAYGDEQTEKFMVVLTDGRQTEPAFGPGSKRNVTQGEKNLETLCGNAKASGVAMITVAFDLEDQATRDRLEACASDPLKHFYVAEDDDELARAFEEIKGAITAQIYISR